MHPFVRSFLTSLVHSNFWIALGAASLTASTQILFGVQDFWVPLFVGCATVPAYYYMRVMKWMSSPNMRQGELYQWTRTHHKGLMQFNFLMTIAALWAFRHLNFDAKMALLIPAVAVLVYSLPFKGKNVGLRQVFGLKLWIISLSWTWVTVIVPLVSANVDFKSEMYWHILQRVLFTVALIIAFDIRDAEYDDPKMGTLPRRIGNRGAKLAAFFALALYDVSLLIQFFTSELYTIPELIALLLPSELLAFLLYQSSKYQSTLLYGFWMDATLVLWWPFLMLASLLQ
jgi:hypothetical protein